MEKIITVVLWVLAILAAPAFARAFTALDEKRYQTAFGYIFAGAFALGIAATSWFATVEVPVNFRNIVLGLVGTVIGSSGLIWVGYVTHPSTAENPSPWECPNFCV
jgi:uncharacterized membrane protein AbrB (regulator of aidB expression)